MNLMLFNHMKVLEIYLVEQKILTFIFESKIRSSQEYKFERKYFIDDVQDYYVYVKMINVHLYYYFDFKSEELTRL